MSGDDWPLTHWVLDLDAGEVRPIRARMPVDPAMRLKWVYLDLRPEQADRSGVGPYASFVGGSPDRVLIRGSEFNPTPAAAIQRSALAFHEMARTARRRLDHAHERLAQLDAVVVVAPEGEDT